MRFALVAVLLATGVPVAAQPAVDPFIAQHDAAAARNPASPRFTISLADGRRAFRVGEPIPIAFRYDNVRRRERLEHEQFTLYARAVIDRMDLTANPDADFERAGLYISGGICCGVEGGVVGGATTIPAPVFGGLNPDGSPIITYPHPPPPPPPPPRPPVARTFMLNHGLRFDAPGRFRLYMEDFHDREPLRRDEAPIISNVIDIEITPRDHALDERLVRTALGVLDSSANAKERRDALLTLRYVGSALAIDEMARRLYRDSTRSDDDAYLEHSLFAVQDRSRVLVSMQAQIENPARLISSWYTRAFAALELTARSPGRFRSRDKVAAMLSADTRRLRALARAGTLIDGLVSTFEGRFVADIAPGLGGFVGELRAALNRLPAPVRETAIERYGHVFEADRRFAPLLEEISRGGSAAATNVLYDLEPSRARPIILRDLASDRPRLPIEISGRLEDQSLPELNAVFLRQLRAATNTNEVAGAFDRIERFGTSAIAESVKAFYLSYAGSRTCAVDVPALAFFFRADPAFARDQFEAIQTSVSADDEQCRAPRLRSQGLLEAIAARRMSDGFEDYAGTIVVGSNAEAAVRAGELLGAYGSGRSKAIVWRGLDQLRSRKSTLPSHLEFPLVRAVVSATNWMPDEHDFERLYAGCRAYGCKTHVTDLRQEVEQDWLQPRISAHRDYETGRRSYYVRSVGVPFEQLGTQVRLFPRGTSFTWGEGDDAFFTWRFDYEADAERVRALLARHGMSLKAR